MKTFLLKQINDSAFPIGSFQHSFGLESFVQKGLVCDAKSLFNFVSSYLRSSFLYNDLLMVKCCYKNFMDMQHILQLEKQLYTSNSASEIRQATRKLGLRFIKTLKSINLPPKSSKNTLLWENYIQISQYPTHASAYGIFCAIMEFDFFESLSYYAYTQTSNMVINGVKLIPLSQDSGQEVLLSLHPTLHDIIQIIDNLDESLLGNSSPHFDIYAMQHEILYSRLYMS